MSGARPIHCFICFEEKGPLLESRDISFCTCRFFVHEPCWEECKRRRAHQDQCPFCNKKLPRSEGWKRPFDLYVNVGPEEYVPAPDAPMTQRPEPTAPVLIYPASYQRPSALPEPTRATATTRVPTPAAATAPAHLTMSQRTHRRLLFFVVGIAMIILIVLLFIIFSD